MKLKEEAEEEAKFKAERNSKQLEVEQYKERNRLKEVIHDWTGYHL